MAWLHHETVGNSKEYRYDSLNHGSFTASSEGYGINDSPEESQDDAGDHVKVDDEVTYSWYTADHLHRVRVRLGERDVSEQQASSI